MKRDQADSFQLAATYVALEEIAEVLEEFEGAVIVGGTVPFLLIPQDEEPHEGTVDIDVVVDTNRLRSDSELTLHEVLERRLFVQDPKRPYRYIKAIEVQGETRQVLVEFLGGGKPPPGGLLWIANEDMYVSVIEGMEIALDGPVATTVAGQLAVRVTSITGFFAMKALAMERREKSVENRSRAFLSFKAGTLKGRYLRLRRRDSNLSWPVFG